MSKEPMVVTVRAKVKVEKYAPGVTKEDIAKGKVKPIEIVERDENFEIDKEQAKLMGLIPEEAV